jgi:hypothetical protein
MAAATPPANHFIGSGQMTCLPIGQPSVRSEVIRDVANSVLMHHISIPDIFFPM